MNITTVVVTYNRKSLLEKCIFSLLHQTRNINRLIVVDNASTDGTEDIFKDFSSFNGIDIIYKKLDVNLGGAGGFTYGIQLSIELGADWIWIMDDDAAPTSRALEELLQIVESPAHIYGSIAINGHDLSWKLTLTDSKGNILASKVEDMQRTAEVLFLPFLGLLIHKDLVLSIGLPDKDFFIAADDVEYCLRARSKGAKIIAAGNSHIYHPKSDTYILKFFFLEVGCLRLPPWKRYYDIRNRIFVAKKYYGLKWIYQTIPGSFLRLLGTLLHEPNKINQIHAFIAGLTDGIFGINGKRHTWWKIK